MPFFVGDEIVAPDEETAGEVASFVVGALTMFDFLTVVLGADAVVPPEGDSHAPRSFLPGHQVVEGKAKVVDIGHKEDAHFYLESSSVTS